MKIIGMSGYARSGKDTFAAALIELGWKRYALADSLKRAALALDPIVITEQGPTRLSFLVDNRGWEQAKENADVRQLLQRLGTEVGRTYFGENAWIDVLDRQIADEDPERVVVTDVRFPNEVEWLRANGGVLIRIERPGVGPANGHASEQSLDEYEVDYIIDNSGTIEDLVDAARAVHDDVINGSQG